MGRPKLPPTKQASVRFNMAEYSAIKAKAEAQGLAISEYLKELIFPPADKMLHAASGGKYSVSAIQIAFRVATELADEAPAWGEDDSTACGWLALADTHCGWLRDNPHHPEAREKTEALMDALPQAVKDKIAESVQGLL